MDKTRRMVYTRAVEMERKIRERTARVGVVGLGYVGLPLSVEFARAGFHVVGLEVSRERAAALRRGRSYISDVPSRVVAGLVQEGYAVTWARDAP